MILGIEGGNRLCRLERETIMLDTGNVCMGSQMKAVLCVEQSPMGKSILIVN